MTTLVIQIVFPVFIQGINNTVRFLGGIQAFVLKKQTVHIVKGSPSVFRILNLSNEIGDTIYVQEIERYGQEQLLAMVANKDIDYAICDESIALSAIHNLPQLDIETAVSFTQFYSWGVHRDNTVLLDSLNVWLENYKKTSAFQQLLKKYTLN